MPQSESNLSQRALHKILQMILLLGAVFLGNLFSGLGMNPFAALAHKALLPFYAAMSITLLLGIVWTFFDLTTTAISGAIIASLSLNWILGLLWSSEAPPPSIALLALLLSFIAFPLVWKFNRTQRKKLFTMSWYSVGILSCAIILFSFLPSPK